MAGRVVRAVKGDRGQYQPIVSGLCRGHDPVELSQALMRYSGSSQMYLADLDALTGGARQGDMVAVLLEALPACRLWLDAAFRDRQDWLGFRARLGDLASRVTPVFASEALASPAALADAFGGPGEGILSLDTRGGQRLDLAGCWDASACWPGHVIVMTLDRVGSAAGPDLDTLDKVRRARPDVQVVGAGGIRNQADLERATASGAWAWLVASAFHDRRLPAVGHGASLF